MVMEATGAGVKSRSGTQADDHDVKPAILMILSGLDAGGTREPNSMRIAASYGRH